MVWMTVRDCIMFMNVIDLMQEKGNNSLPLTFPNDKTNIGGYVHMIILAIHV